MHLTHQLLHLFDISGSQGTLDHLIDGIRDGHATAVLAASIFHFGTYRIGEAKARLAACGIPVRF